MPVDALTVLADAPVKRSAPVQVAKLGEGFRHPSYGEFSITRQDFSRWIDNFRSVKPDVQFDLDHSSERGGSSESAGWIADLRVDGDKLMADVEWTPVGESAIREKRYRFVSPAYGPYRDERGKVHRDVLRSVGLTNRPHLRENMPALALSQAAGDAIDEAEVYRLRDYSAEERRDMAARGEARDDESFPIKTETDLRNAIRLAGNAKDPDGAKRHIRKRARALGKTDLLPDSWQLDDGDDFDELLTTLLDAKSVGPVARGQLRNLLKHYAGKPHPFTTCVRDNTRRFGVEGAKRVCATLKDVIKGHPYWREGAKSLDQDDHAQLEALLDALSEDDLHELTATLADIAEPSDTRAQMALRDDLITALGLSGDVDDKTLLARIDNLEKRPERDEDITRRPGETDEEFEARRKRERAKGDDRSKTLDQQATEAGKVILDANAHAELERKANAGEAAAKQLSDTRFDFAYSKALDEGRIAPIKDGDGKDLARERFKTLYDANADTAIQLLDDLKPIVSTSPRGSGSGPRDSAPEGVDADQFQLDQKVDAHMREHEVDYATALDAVGAA